MNKMRVLGAVALGGVGLVLATPASAGTGCNGVVDITKWGCAPWDNNNGPQFPNWQDPKLKTKDKGPTAEQLRNARLVGNDGASLIGNDSAGLKAAQMKNPPK